RSAGVDVVIGQQVGGLGAHVTDRHQDILRQFALDGEVPRLFVAAVDLAAPGAAFGHAARQCDHAGREVRTNRVGHAVLDGAFPREGVGRHAGGVDHDRIPAAKRAREGNRIVVDAVAGADDGLVFDAVGYADAGREQLVADRDADVIGLAA